MRNILTVLLISLSFCSHVDGQNSSGLILTDKGIESIQSNLGEIPLFDETLATVMTQIDAEIEKGIDVPIPKDLAGGYTHEQHKSNFFNMQKAGVLFGITEDEKYANYIVEMLLEYAEMYPTLDRHPAERSYARGKFFWQCLNDANWLVYTSQAYSQIYDWINEDTRNRLNTTLFRPYAEFLSIETPQFFNRIHNHSTWANAAVGMIGLVMEDEELVTWALYGLDTEVPSDMVKDNDGGFIELEGQKEAGFLAQIDNAFSPDGYYTEGPYYQRYAMYPFLIFANSLANRKPALNILDYRDGLLIKAVEALVNQTNSEGEFFPINDAQKGMSLASRELVTAVSMAYHYGNQNSSLLSIIEQQGRVPLNDAGLAAAKGIKDGLASPNFKSSIQLTDGANGDEGALGILRSSQLSNDITLMLKYAKHGMGHGHFDRLSFLLYHGNEEVFQDYGSSRWVNIEQKDGGGYLKENNTWAKQTIAHNTVVINNTTQFERDVQTAEDNPGTPYIFDVDASAVQVVSAKENNAYPNVEMQRTMVMAAVPGVENEIILDLYRIKNDSVATYELPFYNGGHLMNTTFDYSSLNQLNPMGDKYGYQHLWKEAEGVVNNDLAQVTWFNGTHFYSLTSATLPADEMIFGRIGANDPHFNLRRDPVLIHKRQNSNSTLFANVIEIHGKYNPSDEIPINSFSSVQHVSIVVDTEEYSVIECELVNGKKILFTISNLDSSKEKEHNISTERGNLSWKGPFQLTLN